VRKTVLNEKSIANGLRGNDQKKGGLWFLFAIILFLLGANKQLDLQMLLGLIGRKVASAHGWYQYRRMVLAVFIVVFTIIGSLIAMLIIKKSSKRHREHGISTIGILMLIVVIVIRAADIMRIDRIIFGRNVYIPHKVYSILEFLSILLVGLGGFLTLMRLKIKDTKQKEIEEFKLIP
jgi:hypothetical protein